MSELSSRPFVTTRCRQKLAMNSRSETKRECASSGGGALGSHPRSTGSWTYLAEPLGGQRDFQV